MSEPAKYEYMGVDAVRVAETTVSGRVGMEFQASLFRSGASEQDSQATHPLLPVTRTLVIERRAIPDLIRALAAHADPLDQQSPSSPPI